MQWQQSLAIFIGTLPLFTVILWALLQNGRRFTAIENRLTVIENVLRDIQKEISGIKERLATLEERDRIRLN